MPNIGAINMLSLHANKNVIFTYLKTFEFSRIRFRYNAQKIMDDVLLFGEFMSRQMQKQMVQINGRNQGINVQSLCTIGNKTVLIKKIILSKNVCKMICKKLFTKTLKNQLETLQLTRGQKWPEINSEGPL